MSICALSLLLLLLLLFGLGMVTGCHGRLWYRTVETEQVVGKFSKTETAFDDKYGRNDNLNNVLLWRIDEVKETVRSGGHVAGKRELRTLRVVSWPWRG